MSYFCMSKFLLLIMILMLKLLTCLSLAIGKYMKLMFSIGLAIKVLRTIRAIIGILNGVGVGWEVQFLVSVLILFQR